MKPASRVSISSTRRRSVAVAPRGFSLIEILIVLAILVIVSSVAIVTYGSYRKTLSVKSTASQVSNLFAAARAAAINSNSPHAATFELNTARQSFWIDEMDSTGTTVRRPKIAGVAFPADFVILDDVWITPGGPPIRAGTGSDTLARVVFWPDGRGSYAVVHLRREFDDPGDASIYTSVRVFASTGAARIFTNTYLTE